MNRNFGMPKQVKFIDLESGAGEFMGIAYNDCVICAHCGAVIPIESCEIVKIFDYWVDFSHEINE